MVAPTRTAVVGGDGRAPQRWRELGEVEVYRSSRDGGNGELRRLEHALRAGSFDRVVILASFNGHAATVRVRRICAAMGVEVLIVLGSGRRAAAEFGRRGSKASAAPTAAPAAHSGHASAKGRKPRSPQ